MPSSLRVRANTLDLAIYRRVRSFARTPDTVRWVRSYLRLGEHGGVWLATGLSFPSSLGSLGR